MSDQPPGAVVGADPASGVLRGAGLAAAFLGVAALVAGAFVVSYPGIHAFAVQAGVSTRMARVYPMLADAMLVVTLAAVLSLRGAGLPSRLLAWLVLLLLLAAAAGADAMHAAGRSLPARPAGITAAVLPWVLVLLAFGLLLAMLRRGRPAPEAPSDAGLSILSARPDGADPLETVQAETVQAETVQAETGGQDQADEGAEPGPDEAPVFYRVRSSPTPPAGQTP
jgi:Protein of unknown function (DUF2637)